MPRLPPRPASCRRPARSCRQAATLSHRHRRSSRSRARGTGTTTATATVNAAMPVAVPSLPLTTEAGMPPAVSPMTKPSGVPVQAAPEQVANRRRNRPPRRRARPLPPWPWPACSPCATPRPPSMRRTTTRPRQPRRTTAPRRSRQQRSAGTKCCARPAAPARHTSCPGCSHRAGGERIAHAARACRRQQHWRAQPCRAAGGAEAQPGHAGQRRQAVHHGARDSQPAGCGPCPGRRSAGHPGRSRTDRPGAASAAARHGRTSAGSGPIARRCTSACHHRDATGARRAPATGCGDCRCCRRHAGSAGHHGARRGGKPRSDRSRQVRSGGRGRRARRFGSGAIAGAGDGHARPGCTADRPPQRPAWFRPPFPARR
jgi:hypothetical protein